LVDADTLGVREATVPSSLVPLKPPHLAELKSNNYLLNALTMLAAKDRGGTFGIGVDATGHVTESCVLNVAAISADGTLRTPPFAGILKGTTLRRAMQLAERSLLGPAGSGALLTGIVQEPLSVAEAKAARELILFAGDTHLFAIAFLDGKPIGEGKPGPVFAALKAALVDDAKHGDGEHEPLW